MTIRRVGDPVRAGMRYTHRPGAYAVLARGAQVLLTHQEEPVPEFQLPGGGIDSGRDASPGAPPRGPRGDRLADLGASAARGVPPLHLHAGIRDLG